MEIFEPKPPLTLWTTPGLLRDPFTFNFYQNTRPHKAEDSSFHEQSHEVLKSHILVCTVPN